MLEHGYSIRLASERDAKGLADLITELSRSEGKGSPGIDSEIVADWMDGSDPFFEALVAEDENGELVGYAAFYRGFSLFKPGPVLWVENLYVKPSVRGTGLGRKLICAIAAEAEKRNWQRIELCVREENAHAHGFYAKLGFRQPGESVRRVDDAALSALAQAHRRGI